MPRAKRCPHCGKPAQESHAPFCSQRCREVDLSRWFSGAYTVPAAEEEEWNESTGTPPAPSS